MFGSIAIFVFYLAFFEAVFQVLEDVRIITYQFVLPLPSPPIPHITYIRLYVALSASASVFIYISGLYFIGAWIFKGVLEMRRLPTLCVTSLALFYSADLLMVARIEGYVVLMLTIIAIGLAIHSRGFKFWFASGEPLNH